MPQDWYETVTTVADRLGKTLSASFDSIQSSLGDLDSYSFSHTVQKVFEPAPPPVPKSLVASYSDAVIEWTRENRITASIVVVATGSFGGYLMYKRNLFRKRRRRATRSSNGNRTEVLILTNFNSNPMTKAIAMDFERRGFIIFCICSTDAEKTSIENEGHVDIRPLLIGKGEQALEAVERMANYLSLPAPAYHGSHTLHLAGLVISPASEVACPSGPLEVLDCDQISASVQEALIQPTQIIQSFLPLLRDHSGRILVLNEWIVPSLHVPFRATQIVSAHALRSLTKMLNREIPSVLTIHMRLGTFDFPKEAHGYRKLHRDAKADAMNWSPSLRAAYSKSYRSSRTKSLAGRVKGSPMKELYYAMFDALTCSRTKKEISVGAGVKMYQRISDWLPDIVLDWLLDGRASEGEEISWEVVETGTVTNI